MQVPPILTKETMDITFSEAEMQLLKRFLPVITGGLQKHLEQSQMVFTMGTMAAKLSLELSGISSDLRESSKQVLAEAPKYQLELDKDTAELERWNKLMARLFPDGVPTEEDDEPAPILD